MPHFQPIRVVLALCCLLLIARASDAAEPAPRKIVVIAGKKSHGPEGNRIHDYPWSAKLIKVMFDNSNIADKVRVEYHRDGWPADQTSLQDADAIMIISDGRDGDAYSEAPHTEHDERVAFVQKQVARGCGVVTFHFATFSPDKYATQILRWTGGYFDWEENGKKKWYSAIRTMNEGVQLAAPTHPILRGVKPFKMNEEFYYNIRFQPEDKGFTPILEVPALKGRERDGNIVAWCVERPAEGEAKAPSEGSAGGKSEGSRGFGTTCGHFYENWKNDDFRRLMLNAIAWCAKVEVPTEGVAAKYYEHDEITASLDGVTGTQRAIARPAKPANPRGDTAALDAADAGIFKRDNLVAWCIVPFDGKQRGPVDRADMLQRVGFKMLAYDWRGKDVPTFGQEADELAKRNIAFQGFWLSVGTDPANENDTKAVLDFLRKKQLKTQVWAMFSDAAPHGSTQEQRVEAVARRVAWLADELDKIGCKLGLYNHGGWFGEPENQIAIIEKLQRKNIGIIYNLHHGHGHVDRFPKMLDAMKPHLYSLNLNGMIPRGDAIGQKIMPLGQGTLDLSLLKTIKASGYTGPIGILGHTNDDAELRLLDNLEGLAWLLPQLKGEQPGAAPKPRTPVPAANTGAAAPAAKPTGAASLAKEFGKALDASKGGIVLDGNDAYRKPPITVECWAKIAKKDDFNILIASDTKASGAHWEMFTWPNNGHLTVYTPGLEPDHTRSSADISDGSWHHVAMVYEEARIRLYVDSKVVADQAVKSRGKPAVPGGLAIGRLVEGGIGCVGAIDDVRISKGVREIKEAPKKPSEKDDATLGLWSFEDLGALLPTGQGTTAIAASTPPAPAPAAPPGAKILPADPGLEGGKFGHWGQKNDKDWTDDRWGKSDFGTLFSHTLETPAGQAAKGMAIRLGAKGDAGVVFDTQSCSLLAGWSGAFVKIDPTRFGLIGRHRIVGEFVWSAPKGAAWRSKQPAKFRGLYRHENRVMLSYEVDGAGVLDAMEVIGDGGADRVFARHLRIDPGQDQFTLNVADTNARVHLVGGNSAVKLEAAAAGHVVTIGARTSETFISLAIASGKSKVDDFNAVARTLSSATNRQFTEWAEPVRPSQDARIEVKGTLGDGKHAYTIDTIPVPYDNPHKSLMFLSGVDFFDNGDAAVCTPYGDVWLVRGLDESLKKVTWQRFATGLFQPLGLRIREGKVFVLGRDQITRLHDRNNDGEADFYECFSNLINTSPGGHDYVTSLEVDRNGNFYYVDPKGVHRISADGKKKETLATGWRNPNGMSVGPDGTITAAPQEGDWTPASMIDLFTPATSEGAALPYFGYGGPKVTPQRPLGFDPHLVYLPRTTDNSTGSQVWSPAGKAGERFGPLAGQLFNLSFGQCSMQLILRETVDGVSQGAVVPMPGRFLSGVMRGAFSPRDGQLYVVGMNGWATSAARDGCLQRVRYTGSASARKEANLPIAFSTHPTGVKITFTDPLDKETAQDAGSYALEQWNYKYSSDYGSKEYSVKYPGVIGHDQLELKGATLSSDGKSVFLAIPGIGPVHQLQIKYNVETPAGKEVRGTMWITINKVGSSAP